jgi:hypothetical protein
MSHAWRPLFDSGFAKFNRPDPGKYQFLIWNLYLTDKLTKLTHIDLEREKIAHIVAILPSKEEFEGLSKDIGGTPYTVLEYGESHTTELPLDEYNRIAMVIDMLGKMPQDKDRNILVFCNNGYQRSLPFLVYYLMNFHKDEFPTVESAVKLICRSIPGMWDENPGLTEKIEALFDKKV